MHSFITRVWYIHNSRLVMAWCLVSPSFVPAFCFLFIIHSLSRFKSLSAVDIIQWWRVRGVYTGAALVHLRGFFFYPSGGVARDDQYKRLERRKEKDEKFLLLFFSGSYSRNANFGLSPRKTLFDFACAVNEQSSSSSLSLSKSRPETSISFTNKSLYSSCSSDDSNLYTTIVSTHPAINRVIISLYYLSSQIAKPKAVDVKFPLPWDRQRHSRRVN